MSPNIAKEQHGFRGQSIFSKLLVLCVRPTNEAVEQCSAPLGNCSLGEMNLGMDTSSLKEPEPARSPEGRQKTSKGHFG